METQNKYDIFISYKNDGCGDQYAQRLSTDLSDLGYRVYYNPEAEHSSSFPDRLRRAVRSCSDFLLILSPGCLEQLKRGAPVDWVREELLTAWEGGKNIIPILVDSAVMPATPDEMPDSLRFFPFIDAIKLSAQYKTAPFSRLIFSLSANKDTAYEHRDTFNSNPHYRLEAEFNNRMTDAQDNSVDAMYEIAMSNYYGVASGVNGTSSECDYEQAVYWLRKIIATPNAKPQIVACAHYELARMYRQGLIPGEQQSYEEYNTHMTEAARDYHYASEQQLLADIQGCGSETAAKLISTVAEGGSLVTMDSSVSMVCAELLIKYGKFREAFNIYSNLPEATPEADYHIGLLYKDGVLSDPPKPDYVYAGHYLRSAADYGHLQAAYEYGMLCYRPAGVFRKDFRMAERYLKQAADGGIADAQYVLGCMYRAGHVTRDYSLAVDYLEKARSQLHSMAALELATLYQQSAVKNYQKAYECAEMAASYGIAEAELVLGNMLLVGRGCESDVPRAIDCFTKAHAQGLMYAGIMLEKAKRVRH